MRNEFLGYYDVGPYKINVTSVDRYGKATISEISVTKKLLLEEKLSTKVD